MKPACPCTQSPSGTLPSIPAPSKHVGVTCTWAWLCLHARQALTTGFPVALYLLFFLKQGLLLDVKLTDSWPASSGDQPVPASHPWRCRWTHVVPVLLLLFGLVI